MNVSFDYLEQKLVHVEKSVNETKTNTVKGTKLLEHSFDSTADFKFPISNGKELEALESKLKDPDIKRKLVRSFSLTLFVLL